MNLFALLSSPTAAVVLLIGILCVVILGYLVFYLECQRYAPRQVVLKAVNRYAMICTSLVAILTLSLILNQPAKSSDELMVLQTQVAELQQERAEYVSQSRKRENEQHRLLSVNKGLSTEVMALQESNRALEERVRRAVATPVLASHDPPIAVQEDLSDDADLEPKFVKAAFQEEPPPRDLNEGTASVSTESTSAHKDFRSTYDSLEQLRMALGNSINPAFQAHQESKRSANKLIQELLFQLGYYDGDINGNGHHTFDAVVVFQEASALPQTGIVARRTSRGLLRAYERSLGTLAASTAVR